MTDWPFGSLTPFRYGAILVDPPWKYLMRTPNGYAKSPEAHYDTMTMAELAALPVNQLAAPDALLFMWSTWPHLSMAQDLMMHWGFQYITGGSWNKRGRSGAAMVGTGYWLRSSSEPFLVGKIGKPHPGSRSVTNLIDAAEVPDQIEAVRREHSRKPAIMRDMVTALTPNAWRCELFAREAWHDNDVWGNEVAKFDEAPE